MQATVRKDPPHPELESRVSHMRARKLKTDTVGTRISNSRTMAGLTQMELSKIVGRGRSAVAQWERDDAEPPLELFRIMAKQFKTTAQYLAFGVTTEPGVVYPSPEELGYTLVPEMRFGNTLNDVHAVAGQSWGVPTGWLKNELQAEAYDSLAIFKVEVDHEPYERGDRVIVDRSATRASPPGAFLVWDGYGPSINNVAVLPGSTPRKTMAKVSGAMGQYEIEVDKLQIIGRVRGVWKKA